MKRGHCGKVPHSKLHRGYHMYKIEKTPYGFKLTFGGFIQLAEMQNWLEESKKALASAQGKFGIFVDMRTLKPLAPEALKPMKEGQQLYKAKGMERSVVILNDAVTKMQFFRVAKETGIYQWERYIDASATPNWEQVGVDWLVNAKDPDKVCV